MENYTIAEEYTLPSKGLVYDKQIKPTIKLRSMTTQEEMKRLGKSNLVYKPMSEIIDDCLIEKPGISSYDMCIGDYQFLLYKLRVVTYGPKYKVESICPICGRKNNYTVDLDNLTIREYSDELSKYLNITLPKSGDKIEIRMQTPRILDEIRSKSEDLQKRQPNLTGEPAFLITLQTLISRVNGQALDSIKLDDYVRKMPMADANYILKCAEKLDIGIDNSTQETCKHCGYDYTLAFPITGEFFGPSID